MAKLSISRIFELSRALSTQAGQQLADALQYFSDLAEQVIRSLRNGLTFKDNFDCVVSVVSLRDQAVQPINASKTVTGIIPIRAYTTTNAIDKFNWYYDDSGTLNVKVTFATPTTTAIDVALVILF